MADIVSEQLHEQNEDEWFLRFCQKFIESNYLYVFSALFLLLGATMLRHSSALSSSEFLRTLQSLLVLQGYELALILTSVAIVRHFKKINDAFLLFGIFFVLVLDPTSFSNAFHSMYHKFESFEQSIVINAALFLAANLKFACIAQGIRLKISLRGWFAFSFSAACLYLAEFPLAYLESSSVPIYFTLVLGFLPAVAVLLMPAQKSIGEFSGGEDFASDNVRKRFSNMAILLPPLAIMWHYVQSGLMYEFTLYPAHISPGLLLAAAFLVLFGKRIKELGSCIGVVDILCVLAALFAYPNNGKASSSKWDIMATPAPLVVVGLIVVSIYARHYFLHRDKAALWRLIGMASCGFIYVVFRTGFFDSTGVFFLKSLEVIVRALITNFFSIVAIVSGGFLIEAILKKRSWSLGLIWTAMMWFVLSIISYERELLTVSSSLNFALLSFLIILLFLKAPLGIARTSLTILLFVSLLRFMNAPDIETILFLISSSILALFMHTKLGDWIASIILSIHAFIFMVWSIRHQIYAIHPAWAVIGFGFILFAFGVLITFQKERLQNLLKSFTILPTLEEESKDTNH